MSENRPKYDENDPKIKERLAVLARINENTADRYESWADLYAGLKSHVHEYGSAPCKETADFVITLMHCFVLALEDLPEEGDAKVICRRMNEIMVMQPERTGVALYFGEEAEAMRKAQEVTEAAMSPLVAQLIGGIAQRLGSALSEDDEPPKSRTVH